MAEVSLSIAEFREQFVAFRNTTEYTDSYIQGQMNIAKLYISPEQNCMVKDDTIKQLIYLMTAHLMAINNSLKSGSGSSVGGGQIASASVGGVSVSKAIPNNRTELDYWLNLTPYGMQLLALLSMLTGIGFYMGGQRENVFR